MIQPILDNIAAYILTNTGSLFRSGYSHVTSERRTARDGTEQVVPVAWTGKTRDGLPMFQDFKANSFYLRIDGEPTSDQDNAYDSCAYTMDDTYAVRAVFHIRERESGDYARRRASVFSQLLANYKYTIPATSDIQRVKLRVTGQQLNRYDVIEQEAEGLDFSKIDQTDSFVSIDFDLRIRYNASACIEDDLFCAGDLSSEITQVIPCQCPITTIFPSGIETGYVRPSQFQNSEELCTYEDGAGAVIQNTGAGFAYSSAAVYDAVTPPFSLKFHHLTAGRYSVGFVDAGSYVVQKANIEADMNFAVEFDADGGVNELSLGFTFATTANWSNSYQVGDEIEIRNTGTAVEFYAGGVLVGNWLGVAPSGGDCVPVVAFYTPTTRLYDFRAIET